MRSFDEVARLVESLPAARDSATPDQLKQILAMVVAEVTTIRLGRLHAPFDLQTIANEGCDTVLLLLGLSVTVATGAHISWRAGRGRDSFGEAGMRIGQLAQATGLSTHAIRYYEREGLLAGRHVGRRENSYRDYSESAIERIGQIGVLASAGFTLSEIRDLLVRWDEGRITLAEGRAPAPRTPIGCTKVTTTEWSLQTHAGDRTRGIRSRLDRGMMCYQCYHVAQEAAMTRQLVVRNVDEGLVRALKRRASRHGRSAEAEHREILRAALRGDLERASFKHALLSMPDVGTDDDFTFGRDLPRDVP